jgi:uncharacterized membrane protein YvlD (DUF360 family)
MKGVLVLIGWAVVFLIVSALSRAVIMGFYDTAIQGVPLESAIPVVILTIGIVLPIIYSAIFLITPLFMATLEVFSREH